MGDPVKTDLVDAFEQGGAARDGSTTQAATSRPRDPKDVRTELDGKRKSATDLRAKADDLRQSEEAFDRDATVAAALAEERQSELDAVKDRHQEVDRRLEEIEADEARWNPERDAALDKVNQLRRVVGEPVPSDELMNPDGTPVQTPVVAVETDPTKLAARQAELVEAKAELQTLLDSRKDLDAEQRTLTTRRTELASDVADATKRWEQQQKRAGELKQRSESVESEATAALGKARTLESEATALETGLPQLQQDWEQWTAANPPPTDLGEITVSVTPRERAGAYAQGRREEAAKFEKQAADEEQRATDAVDGARSRTELAAIRIEEAADLNRRADGSSQRAVALQGEADEAMARAEKLAAEADKLKADEGRQRAAGRTETADVMKERFDTANRESIEAAIRSGDLKQEATRINEAGLADRMRAADLTKEAETLKTEAATLTEQAANHTTMAGEMRKQIDIADQKAAAVEAQLDSGKPFVLKLEAGDGTSVDVTVPVPAPEPTPAPDGTGAPDSTTTAPLTPNPDPAVSPPADINERTAPMADPKPLPRDHPDYRHPSATAPPEAIMDAGDMAMMRDKLRAGHNVVVGSDGHIRVSPDPVGPPMTAEAETFIESRLGEVRRLALEGVDTRISPDGNMFGSGSSNQVQHAMGPDSKFTPDELGMIENALEAGYRVSVRPDGSIFTGHYPNDKVLTLEERQARVVEFNRMKNAGELERHLTSGDTVQFVADKVATGVLNNPLPAPIEFPEPGGATDGGATEPHTPAALKAEADGLTAEAVKMRKDAKEAYLNESEQVAVARDNAARRAYGAENEAKASDQQVLREQRTVAEHRAEAAKATKAADELTAKGKLDEAAEQRETAQRFTERAETASTREWVARDAGKKLRAEAKAETEKVTELEAKLTRVEQRQDYADKAADAREVRAELLNKASTQLSEAERLDGEAVKARADGDTMAADDIQRAADYTRKLGTADLETALRTDIPSIEPMGEGSGGEPVRLPPPISPDMDGRRGPLGATGDPAGTDIAAAMVTADVLGADGAADPLAPAASSGTGATDAAATADASVAAAGADDPNEIQMPAMDLTGGAATDSTTGTAADAVAAADDPNEIQMPEMDLSGGSAVDPVAGATGDPTATVADVDPVVEPDPTFADDTLDPTPPAADTGLGDDQLA